jgi:protein-S-isoprenylcysteine O-methyltransferase Ste14
LSRLELRVPPPVAMAAAVFFMWAAGKAVPALDFRPPPWFAVAALFAAALAIGVGAFLKFRKLRTTINPMNPHESTALATDGLYAWSRNPIYLADVLALLACALLVANALAFLFVVLFVAYVDRFQIRPEERALRGRFGAQYQRYCERVRRWL